MEVCPGKNISGTLPNVPVNTIVLDENSNQTLYIGTDLGVFTKDSTTSDWSGFNNNSLPNVIVSELEIQYQSNKLIAATYGRGLWSIDLQITSPPTANFFADDSVFAQYHLLLILQTPHFFLIHIIGILVMEIPVLHLIHLTHTQILVHILLV